MTRKKRMGDQPAYIRALSGEGEQVQISFRVAAELKTRFEAAQQMLHEDGQDMALADVLRSAMIDAAEYVESRYQPSTRGYKQEANHFAGKRDVEHSSKGSVEEWGAGQVVEVSSTDWPDPPLTGSDSPDKASPGVVLQGAGGRDGKS